MIINETQGMNKKREIICKNVPLEGVTRCCRSGKKKRQNGCKLIITANKYTLDIQHGEQSDFMSQGNRCRFKLRI